VPGSVLPQNLEPTDKRIGDKVLPIVRLKVRQSAVVNEPSDPFLFAGFKHKGVHLTHDNSEPVRFTLETDFQGNGNWSRLKQVTVSANGYLWCELGGQNLGPWIRIRTDRNYDHATVYFQGSNPDPRIPSPVRMLERLGYTVTVTPSECAA
jgi:hypothetical protein